MSSREKKLLTFFLVAIFAIGNLYGFQWLQTKRQAVQAENITHEGILIDADMSKRMKEAVAGEIEWLDENVPEPKEGELVPSQLENLVTTEAARAGITMVKVRILDNDTSGNFFHRAQFNANVTGNEASLYRWLVRLHSPRDFRAVTAMRLSPNREDDALIDAQVQIEQWFVPKTEEEMNQAQP